MKLKPLIVVRAVQSSWILMPALIERIRKFPMDGGDVLAEAFQESFLRADNKMLLVALVGDDKRLHGHLLAGVEHTIGPPWAMLYQFEKDCATDNWPDVNGRLEIVIEQWAAAVGVTDIIAKAGSVSRVRLFSRFGFKHEGYIVKKSLGQLGAKEIGAEVRPLRAVGD